MVLSNKKLKQKLREKLAESLISSVAGKDSNGERKPESRPQSLRLLLGAASSHGLRLSKREKRRESVISNDEEKKEGEVKNEKKRKRGEGVKEKSGVDGVEADDEKARKLKRNKKNVKKKKKQKINKKARNGEEEKEKEKEKHGGEDVIEMKVHVEESHDNVYSQVNENVNQDVATKVYVGGIPYYSTEDDICSFFESCGTITDVDCMKFPESGKFRGIAILSFKTEAAVKRALAMDGSDMGGFFLKVQPYKGTRTTKAVDFSPGIVEGYNRIYLGNLSWDATEDDLKNLFANCKIASIRFGMDKDTGEFRGFAHIDFSDSVSLKTALKLDQETIHGRPVKIRCAVPKIGSGRGGAAPPPPALATAAPPAPAAAAPPAFVTAETLPKPVPEMKEGDSELSAVSGKVKRRTCYECGEKGHLSSNCPKKQLADSVAERGAAPPPPALAPPAWAVAETLPKPVPEMKEADWELSAVSGKIKRRTCYECGEKGHLSSNCPKKQLADSVAERGAAAPPAPAPAPPAWAVAETLPKPVPEMKEADSGLSALSGKIKRRTCYECGEKGHLSSNCPNKQLVDSVAGREAAAPPAPIAAAPTAAETLPKPVSEMKEADSGLSAVSGKIKRRTCYECGEKGHLSSNCPKKQLADSVAS